MHSIYEKALLHKYVLAYQLTDQLHRKQCFLRSFLTSQKIVHIVGTQRFSTLFTTAYHVSLSWPTLIQSTPSNLILLRFILIFTSHLHLGLSSGSFLQISLAKPSIHLSFLPCVPNSPAILLPLIRSLINVCWGVKIIKLLGIQFSPFSCYFLPLRSKYLYLSQHSNLEHPQPIWSCDCMSHHTDGKVAVLIRRIDLYATCVVNWLVFGRLCQ